MKLLKQLIFLLSTLAFCTLHAQVPVYQEPFHKQVLKNKYIRLIDVHLHPGDTTQFHVHAAASVFIHFTTSTIGSQVMGQPLQPPAIVEAGFTRFTDYAKDTLVHRVYNAGRNIFHVMDIELMNEQPAAGGCEALQQKNVTITVDEKRVRMYKLVLAKQDSLYIPGNSCAYLLACISGSVNVAGKNIPEGGYIFFDPGSAIAVLNSRSHGSACILVELK